MSWIQKGEFEAIWGKNGPIWDKEKFLLRITKPYIYEYKGKKITIPIDFLTNGHSNPDVLEHLTGDNYFAVKELIENGETKAAIVETNSWGCPLVGGILHDYVCERGLSGAPVCSWDDAQDMFYHAMLDNGVKKWGKFTKLFGDGAWMKYQAVKFAMRKNKWKY